MKHLDITVTGKVQGVFFRAATRDKAVALGLAGRVSNRADGGVQVEAEGDEEQLQALLSWLHVGPPRARVDAVAPQEGELRHYACFDISR